MSVPSQNIRVDISSIRNLKYNRKWIKFFDLEIKVIWWKYPFKCYSTKQWFTSNRQIPNRIIDMCALCTVLYDTNITLPDIAMAYKMCGIINEYINYMHMS